jgi:vitamin-K-epoxide reductase (warfarin-sensitive)
MSSGARRIMLLIAVLATSGAIDSLISLERHYAASMSSYCDLGERLNCDLVNRSTYSRIFGIPVAALGVLGYLVLLALTTFHREKAETPAMLAVASLTGLGFSVYLTYVEAFILATWCILCLSSLMLIFLIAVLSSLLLVDRVRRRKAEGLAGLNIPRESDQPSPWQR